MQGIKRVVTLTALLLLSCFIYAQDESYPPAVDTVSPDEDSAITIIEEPYTDTYQSETRTDYFLPKDLPEAGMNPVSFRKLPDTAVAALRADDDFWYANHVFVKDEPDNKDDKDKGQTIGFWNGFLWFLIIAAFITFLVIYLVNSNVTMLRRSKTIKGKEEEEEVEMDNIFVINYQKEIDKAINAGNYRLAVRLMFLRLLRQLSDKNVIQYKQDRTNFDYLMQLSNTVWYKPFFRLTRNYEYVWYGKFDINNHQFDTIKNEFNNLERQL